MGSSKDSIKNFLGQIPLTAEVYWLLRQRGKPISRFSLKHLQAELPGLVQKARQFRAGAAPGKKVFIFASLHYWIEHAALVGIALAAQGHQVTLGYLPYSEWQTAINLFDLRRQNAYARKVLECAGGIMNVVSFLQIKPDFRPLSEPVKSIASTPFRLRKSTRTLRSINSAGSGMKRLPASAISGCRRTVLMSSLFPTDLYRS